MRLFVWRVDGKTMSVGRTSARMSECKLEKLCKRENNAETEREQTRAMLKRRDGDQSTNYAHSLAKKRTQNQR